MKKQSIKKICAVVLSAAILTSAFSGFTVSASEQTPLILGDANLDGSVSIDDATEIQKYCRNHGFRHQAGGCRKCGQH